MKIIEGLKKAKDLLIKAEDLRQKIAKHSADLDIEAPVYPDQKAKVAEWLQSHSDVLKEISTLRFRVQKTNVLTAVTIELGGKQVTKSVAEWIHRRRDDLAKLEMSSWSALTDRNLKDGGWQTSTGAVNPVKVRRHYDPATRDEKMELYRSEPSIIDGTLEIVNATTDLID